MPEPRVYNTSPRPRMIIRGFDARPETPKLLAALAPTSIRVASLDEVSQDEWDVLVTDERVGEALGDGFVSNSRRSVAEHLYVVFQSSQPGYDIVEALPGGYRVERSSGHIRRELRRPEGVTGSVQPLLAALEPVLRARLAHEHFDLELPPIPRGPRTHPTPNALRPREAQKPFVPRMQPFAETADGKVLAGRYDRSPTADAWLVPSDAPNFVQWVASALAEWHSRDPKRFPGSPDWTRQRAWATQTERDLLDEIDAISAERQSILEQLRHRELDTAKRLTEARNEADTYERALLTSDSDTLARAVHRALADLGFNVTDADRGQIERLEDLRVEDPDAPGWVALVEVKGYSKGAQTGALTQFIRFERRFRQSTGREPDALWYVANQFKERDPVDRQTILQGNEADVTGFAESNGQVIDTVELFRLLDAVRTGRVAAAEARKSLRTNIGRFDTQQTPTAASRGPLADSIADN